MAYWDTSCLLKLYVEEADSDLYETFAGSSEINTSTIARFELLSAVRRKEALGELPNGGATRAMQEFDVDVSNDRVLIHDLGVVVRLRFEEIVEQCWSATTPIAVRTLDAIHLATALALSESQIVATDKRLRQAATLFGLSII